ncbi:MAG: hypothetical protein DRJ05_17805 [Bacteroidetes bacterium]|nr:MAG: hypothetical protein DRJ05_17805 [Bacteroidota bacterium]
MKTTIFTTLLAVITSLAHAQHVVNDGGNIVTEAGSVLVIEGDFQNNANSDMNNNGEVKLTGNWTNDDVGGNLLQGTTGTVTLNGTSTQTIGGTAKTWFNDVDVQNNASIGTETSVSSNLNLTGGNVSLGSSDLKLQSGANITGAGPTQYIVAESSGRLIQEVGAGSVSYPVGTSVSYVPATLSNSGTTDNFGLSVFGDVLDSGTTGSTIPEIDNCVNNTWNITEETAGGSDLSVTTQWNVSDEGSSFDQTQSGLGHYTAGNWDPQEATAAQGTGPHTLTRSGITSLSAFAVGDVNSPMVIQLVLTIDLTAFLEGPFDLTDMNMGLNTAGVLPLAQPFNTAPWNYNGTETVATIPANTVDWVLIEIRDAADAASATPATVIERQAAFVLNDGQIVGLDGSDALQSVATIINNLFVVIYHRNHFSVLSASALTESGGVYPYNFTTGEAQAYGGANGHKEIATNIWGMVAGDANADGDINVADKSIWENQAGTQGYKSTDFDLDGQVGNQDKNEMWVPNDGAGGQVPE